MCQGGLNTEDRGGCPWGFSTNELIRTFGVSEDPDGEVFDVRRPLRRQLEELDVVPLDAVDRHCGAENTIKPRPSPLALTRGRTRRTPQHGLLLLGSADESADALDHLALGLHLLVLALFWQEHDWRRRKGRHTHTHIPGKRAIQRLKVKPVKVAAIKAPAGSAIMANPSCSSPWSPPSWTCRAGCSALRPLVAAG